MYPRRLQKLRAQFDGLGIDVFLITHQPHLRYLSGFSGSSGIGVVSLQNCHILTDGRYKDQIRHETKGWKIYITQGGLFDEMRRRSLLKAASRVGFDGNTLIYSQFRNLRKIFPGVRFLPKVECVEKVAVVKDSFEIAYIKKAVAITDSVFNDLIPFIQPGVSELDIAAEISYMHKKHGADADAFDSIVASGDRSALPHWRASPKKVKRGELITLDFGCVYNGYHSDLTRTVALGRPSPEARKIYAVVIEAQERAIGAAASGMKAKDLDAVARGYIKARGYDKFFRHSLGHGLGLQIHEPPRISALSKATLESGNVITIEPGVYIPGFGGVRIEDDIVIRDGSSEVLNKAPKEFMIL